MMSLSITKKIVILMACTFSLGLGVAYFVINSNTLDERVDVKNNVENKQKNVMIKITAEQQKQFPLLLDLQKNKISFPSNGIRIVNFWATWCDSCIREMPLLNQLQQNLHQLTNGKNATVIGIALDNPTDVRHYLQKKSLHYPTLLGGIHGMELMATLGNQSGNLPYTVVLNEKNEVVYQKMGELKADVELLELHQILKSKN